MFFRQEQNKVRKITYNKCIAFLSLLLGYLITLSIRLSHHLIYK